MTDPIRMTSVEILRHLVSFDTTSRNPNAALIDWIEHYLASHGILGTRSRGPEDGKFNLHAIIGPERAGGIGFSGHVDTVPVDGQAWSADPFALREEDGRLYARGAVDMKGFVACLLAAAPDIAATNPTEPVHLMITFDEEITCNGARYLARDLGARDLLPALCIVGEPTMMTPVIAHKGRLAVRVTIRGKSGHSSRPEGGVNALHAMGEAIAWIAEEARRFAREGIRVEGFAPEHTTTQVGLASGGAILNIIPEQASFDVEWRTVPGDDGHAALARLQAYLAATTEPWMKQGDPDTGFSYEILTELPPLSLNADAPLATLVRRTTGANDEYRVSYGTEAGIYQNAGVSSIVCGPGDIAQAHRPDEWIARSQLDACDSFIRTIARQSAPA
jgi:acetylornithine deacetylase